MIAIIDYGVGNLFSLQSSLNFIGVDAVITKNEDTIRSADQIILPGVGAYGDAIRKLKEDNLDKLIIELVKSGKPLLGICLGMQLLFEKGYEFGIHNGLALLDGQVISMKEEFCKQGISLKVPHIGWNTLEVLKKNSLVDVESNNQVYYVHSFYVVNCKDSLVAVSDYGLKIPGLVQKGNIYGAQFHPEKSGQVGLNILKKFSEVR